MIVLCSAWRTVERNGGNVAAGERLSDVAVMLRSKIKDYIQVICMKLVENTRLNTVTNLKKILRDSKQKGGILRYKISIGTKWDKMSYGFLKTGKITWYRSSTVAVSILDETFASHMQQLLGDTLQENDLEPPSFIAEVRSIIGC
ncbi:hypothetical protein Tco_1482902 [Tanacetum coccineum]